MAQPISILLIDGTSYIFRAFYALPPLTNSQKHPTGALYGFCAMIHKLLQDYPATPMVLFFDAGGKNWRHDLYDAYKAHRQAPPDELILQIKALSTVLPFFGMPVVQQYGVEADDLIAIAARHYSKKGRVLISSPDKDFTQLVSNHIMLEQSLDSKRYDKDAVEQKYGLPQEKMIDYFSLIGDSSDGIPGVPKIGPKTAVKLLQQYGSLDTLLEQAAHIPGAVGRSLETYKDQAVLSRNLFMLATEDQISWPAALPREHLPAVPQLNITALYDFYEKYELRSLFPRLKKEVVYPTITIEKKESVDDLDLSSPLIALFTDGKIVSLASNNMHTQYLEEEQAQSFLSKLHLYNNCFIVSDYSLIRPLLQGAIRSFHDLSLISYVLAADKSTDFAAIEQNTSPGRAAPHSHAELSARVFYVYEKLLAQMDDERMTLLHALDYPLCEILYQMQKTGITLDSERLLQLSEQWGAELALLKEQIVSLAGENFNINSSKQLREVLFEKLKLQSSKKTPKGELSTKEDVLLGIRDQHPIIDILLSYRHLEKLRSTYTTSLAQQVSPESQRLHTTFDQKGTVTGRLASSQPNLQNIPVKTANGRQIRSAFCAPEGRALVFFDYSQIELRLMAHMSQDPLLLQAYRDGEDIHRQTAMLVLGLSAQEIGSEQRQIAKTVNFGLLYGMSAYGLSQQLQISPKKAQQFIDTYFERFPKIQEYMQSMRDFAKENGYVKTLFGRHIPIRVETGRRGANEHAWRAAINGPLQGTASDLIKRAMIDLQGPIAKIPTAQLLLQVHDELIFEVDAAHAEALSAVVKPIMESALKLDIPLIVEHRIATRWE